MSHDLEITIRKNVTDPNVIEMYSTCDRGRPFTRFNVLIGTTHEDNLPSEWITYLEDVDEELVVVMSPDFKGGLDENTRNSE